MRQQQIRQGDVLLVPTPKCPSAKAQSAIDHGRVILAYGEVTGHVHEVIGGTFMAEHNPSFVPHILSAAADDRAEPARPTDIFTIVPEDPDPVPAMTLCDEPDGARILVVRRDAVVRHAEHSPVALVPGHYEIIRQREYSPGAIRNVAD